MILIRKNQFDFIFEIFSESLTKRDFVNWQNLFHQKRRNLYNFWGKGRLYFEQNFKEIYSFLNSLNNKYNSDILIDYTGGLVIDYEEFFCIRGNCLWILSFYWLLILWLAFRMFLPIFFYFLLSFGLVITIGVTTF